MLKMLITGGKSMAKMGFIASTMLTLIGIVTMLLTRIINAVIPKIGLAAFQAAAAGSYRPENYLIDFSTINYIAAILIIIGVILSVKFYLDGCNS
jgi:hypothetical protein